MGHILTKFLSYWAEPANYDQGEKKGGFQKESTPSIRIVLEQEVPHGAIRGPIHLEVDIKKPVSVLRKNVCTIFQEDTENVNLLYNGEALTDSDTLEAKGVDYGDHIVYRNARLDEDPPSTW